MYVLPFFSFQPLGRGQVALRHALTGQHTVVGESVLDSLERLYDGGTVDDATVEHLERMHLVFARHADAEAWMRQRDAAACRPFPIVDQIELTNRCPYRCKMCPRTSSMTRGVGDMDLALFGRIIEQIAAHQKYVGLHHFGESLLHRGLVAAVAQARAAGVATGLSCNPPSLKPRLAQRLLDAGLAELVLSLDSLDPDTYRAIRGAAADIDLARKHVDTLVRLRDAGGYATTITLQLIHMRDNAAETDDFLSYCRAVGVDRGVVVRLGRWDFDDGKLAAMGEFTTALHDAYCTRPSESVVVLWDGRVAPCCHDYDGAVVLGDLKRQTLEEVWRSMVSDTFRSGWNATPLCRECAFSRSFREARRAAMGFRAFHRAGPSAAALEYVAQRPGTQRHFDGFDVLRA